MARGEHYLPPRLLSLLSKKIAEPSPFKQAKLTKRELDVITYIARGHTYKEVAAVMGIVLRLLLLIVNGASEKLGIKTRVELIRWAVENKLLS